MAKTYLDIVKYMVEARFTISGVVDKPDIIGAVFGQTEGLLGDELDLRELQKSGKIGRIEIELSPNGGRSSGRLYLPASLDRIETCILAAAVESVDRVGPYEAEFAVSKVEDTRSEKRRKILSRAKDLVKQLLNTEMPDSKELSELVQADVRTSEITTYGQENLPAGPEAGKSPELVIVEGRADVLNLLRNDVKNVVAIGGATTIPRSIINLCREKEVTVFLDGDRGGDLILRSLVSAADIDYVTRAPDGKEVEDLTRKEIIKAMRTRVPLDQYNAGAMRNARYREQRFQRRQEQDMRSMAPEDPGHVQPSPKPDASSEAQSEANAYSPGIKQIGADENEDAGIAKVQNIDYPEIAPQQKPGPEPVLETMVLTELSNGLDALSGTLRSRLYDRAGNVVREMPIRELLPTVQNSGGVYAIVLDGVITQRLVELALQKGIRAIYGLRSNPMQRKHSDILLYTKEHGTIN